MSAGGFYSLALHWSLTQFSPATQNITPTNITERVFATCVVITAIGLLTSLASSISGYATQIRAMQAASTMQDSLLNNFFVSRKVSNDLSIRIKVFTRTATRKYKRLQHERDIPVLAHMPETMRVRLHDELYMPVVLSSPLLSQLYDIDRSFLVRACHSVFTERSVPPRYDVFLDNTECQDAIYTVSGSMLYYQDRKSVFERMHEKGQDRSSRAASRAARMTFRVQQSQMMKVLTPSVSREQGGQNSELGKGLQVPISESQWLAEMALWSDWTHCGMLVSETAADMILMHADEFARLADQHGGSSAPILHKVAIVAVAEAQRLQEKGRTLTDMGFEPSTWQHVFLQAKKFRDRNRGGLF
eukprot:TRINITY_DN48450_c0_g1_i1.p1 TRINITY_DN48450_c0_g1~~TRINITY_DN48450_c0_g1_i1.p1  ORF type:complete len:419 (-),score=48.11 TRINITY_DN48450_c0_g1_i1:207-1283(-)